MEPTLQSYQPSSPVVSWMGALGLPRPTLLTAITRNSYCVKGFRLVTVCTLCTMLPFSRYWPPTSFTGLYLITYDSTGWRLPLSHDSLTEEAVTSEAESRVGGLGSAEERQGGARQRISRQHTATPVLCGGDNWREGRFVLGCT